MSLPSTVPYIGWAWDDLVFLVLAGVMLGGGMMVVLSRNIIRSGLFMVLSFLGLAGIYALAGATLVAAAQVLVYIGAIAVLILFAVMLTQSKSGPARLVFQRQAGQEGQGDPGAEHLQPLLAHQHEGRCPATVQPGGRGRQAMRDQVGQRQHGAEPHRVQPGLVDPGHEEIGRAHV